jgi:hypothetical protein
MRGAAPKFSAFSAVERYRRCCTVSRYMTTIAYRNADMLIARARNDRAAARRIADARMLRRSPESQAKDVARLGRTKSAVNATASACAGSRAAWMFPQFSLADRARPGDTVGQNVMVSELGLGLRLFQESRSALNGHQRRWRGRAPVRRRMIVSHSTCRGRRAIAHAEAGSSNFLSLRSGAEFATDLLVRRGTEYAYIISGRLGSD